MKSENSFLTYSSGNEDTSYQVFSESLRSLGLSKLKVMRKDTQDHASFVIPMIGDVFCENFAAAIISAHKLLNKSLTEIEANVSNHRASPVPGRLELVRNVNKPWRPLVYVDYAHTPDALKKAIQNLKSPNFGLITIFGCGGDRDKLKRPLMGEIASCLADKVVLTSDNPRTENPSLIIKDILAGISSSDAVLAIENRHEAIDQTITKSGARNTILIAGKGHENYQIIGPDKRFFSDQHEASKALSKNKTWLVFGAGVSGYSAARLLALSGENVLLSDDNPIRAPKDLPEQIQIIAKDDIPWREISHVVLSPGVPFDNAVVKFAKSCDIECLTEIDLGFDRYKGSIIAVTGTNGKSTTVAMTESLFKSAGSEAVACGNIGLPPTSLNFPNQRPTHTAVVELSSYQLEGCYSWPASGAAFTSFSFDHLARHKTIENYFTAKWRITEWLNNNSIFVLTSEVARFAESQNCNWPKCRTIIISHETLPTDWLPHTEKIFIKDGQCEYLGKRFSLTSYQLVGSHNQLNGLTAALLTAHHLKMPLGDLLPGLRGFTALPYRCDVVFNESGRIIVNDSKSTNLESTMAALSMSKRPAILLMGGQGKGESYKSLSLVRGQIHTLITFGASRNDIILDSPSDLPTEVYEKMKDAVLRGLELARDNNWDVVFSPGCASFDEFKNFEHRGEVFNQLVAEFHSSKLV